MGSSKQKQPQVQYQNTTNTNIPTYAKPYFEDVLARTQAEANRPYQTYGGQRTAGFTDAETQSQQGIMGLTTPGQFGASTQMATEAGNYTPGQFNGGYDQAQFTGGDYGTGQFDGGYNPTQFTGGDYATGQFGGSSGLQALARQQPGGAGFSELSDGLTRAYGSGPRTGGPGAILQQGGGQQSDPNQSFSRTGGRGRSEEELSAMRNYDIGQRGQQPGGGFSNQEQYRRAPETYVEEPMLNFEQSKAKQKAQLAEQGGVTRVSDEVLESMKLPDNLKSYAKQMGGIPEGDSDYFQRAIAQKANPEEYKQQFGELAEFSPSKTGGQGGGQPASGRASSNTDQFGGGYNPTQFTGGDYAAGQFDTNSFNDPGMASQYMSPYMQNVVDVQKQSAIRDAKQGQLAGNLGAARQGTYGGSRQLLANMERERNLGTQLGSIQATGSQAAFEAGQRQFGSEQDRRMQAQQYGEQSRQFGGSQSMEAQRQAEQSRQYGAGFGMDAQKQREASRQFGSTRQLQEQQERERANQFRANFGMDAQRQREQSRQFGATQRTQAEQSAAAERQFGANYRMDAQRQAEQSRQYAGNQRLSAAQYLGQLGTSQQQADMQRLNAQNAVGETRRGLEQTRLNTAYDDFQRQRDYPMDQLGRYAGIIQGLPMTPNTTTTQYGQAPSALAGLAGTAAAAYGGYKTFGGAAGGEIRSYNNGGLVALAEGGVGGDVGGGDEKPIGDLGKQAKDLAALMRGDLRRIEAIPGIDPTVKAMALLEVQTAMKAPQAPPNTVFQELVNKSQAPQGLASIAPPPMDPTQSQQPPPPTMTAANGGLMNINLPDDYYDEDSYSHGGIAHFASGQEVADQIQQAKRQQIVDNSGGLLDFLRGAPSSANKDRLIRQIHSNALAARTYVNPKDLANLTEPELEAIAEGKAPPPTPSSDMFGNTERDENSFLFSTPEENTPRTATDKPQVTPAAPQGLAQLQEVDMSTMPTRTPEKVDYMAKAKEYFADLPSPYKRTPEELAAMKKQQGYETLMQLGAHLAGTNNPSFIGGLGEAVSKTAPYIAGISKARRDEETAYKKEDRDMRIVQIQTALGLEKDDAEKVFKQQELALEKQKVALQDKLTNAQIINLGKPDNLYDLMESNPALAEKIIELQKTGQMTESVALKAATAVAQSNPEFFQMPPETQVNYINDLKTSFMAGSGSGNQDTPSEKSTKVGRFDMETL